MILSFSNSRDVRVYMRGLSISHKTGVLISTPLFVRMFASNDNLPDLYTTFCSGLSIVYSINKGLLVLTSTSEEMFIKAISLSANVE